MDIRVWFVAVEGGLPIPGQSGGPREGLLQEVLAGE